MKLKKVLSFIIALALVLSCFPAGIAADVQATEASGVQTPTVVYTCGSVQAEGSIHVETFTDATAALREKNRQWKSDDVVEIQFVGDISGGARGDIHQATAIARKMVCVYGMSDKLGPIEYGSNHSEVFLARDISQTTRNFSEHTAQIIDEEIQRIVTENYNRAVTILTENKERLLLIADKLIEFETLSGKQVAELLETGEMTDPPVRQLPPPMPVDEDAPTDLQTPDDQPPADAEEEAAPEEEKKDNI